MSIDYSNKNLQKESFKNALLINADFSYSDVRGADFSGADLTGTNFTRVSTGIRPANAILLFFAALMLSLLAGYLAMLVARSINALLVSTDLNLRIIGIVSIVLNVSFILYAYFKGGGKAIRQLVIPAFVFTLVNGIVAYLLGLGTGLGMFYVLLSFFLLVIMLILGTTARTVAGTLSNIFFLVVAVSGGLFSKSLGGGIGTMIMAIACALISKKALSGAKGFDFLKKIAFFIIREFGTSFRNSKLTGANFFHAKIQNADFTGADLASANWSDSKKINCIEGE